MTICTFCGTEPCFRCCTYCGTDCELPEPVHAAECPFVTGLYPVRERDVQCPGGCGCVVGLRCGRCDSELIEGDIHALARSEHGAFLVVCLGCAVIGAAVR